MIISQDINNSIASINDAFQNKPLQDALLWVAEQFPNKVCYSTAFDLEGQLIAHHIFTNKLPIRVFTIDTGRHFQETYKVWAATFDKYQTAIETYFPDKQAAEAMMAQKGPNSFYASVENRLECCYIRKVEPLQRALKGQTVWLSGLRAEHSANRAGRQQVEWDDNHSLIKAYPLFHWKLQDVKAAVQTEGIPYNELMDKGFPSVGCAPCTRPVKSGEDERSGRWWWETNNGKECGLHTNKA